MLESVLLGILLFGVMIFAIRRGIPGLITQQGYSHQDKGEYEAAEQCFFKALSFEKAIQKITGQRIGVALQYSNLGFVYHHQKRLKNAASMFKRAIEIYTDLRRLNDAAPIYGSLGKVYFDSGDLDLAEETLKEALTIYSRRPHAQEAMDTITALINLISERRQNTDEPSKYTNTEYGFSFTIPTGWVKQRLVQQFLSTGGQVAISHETHKATFNVSVGPPDRLEWREKETRARAVRDFLTRVQGRIGSVKVMTSTSAGGESNTVSAEYIAQRDIWGVSVKVREGLISIIHNELEYTIQWSAMPGYESQVREIIASFKFEK